MLFPSIRSHARIKTTPGRWSALALSVATFAIVTTVSAQQPNLSRRPTSVEGRIDENTVWTFRVRESVAIPSTVIRLGDVVEPLDRDLAAWPRLSRCVIGLVPVGETKTVLDRDRLSAVVNRAEAIPKTIRWYGPDKIKIEVRPELGEPPGDSIRKTSYNDKVPIGLEATADATTPSRPSIDPVLVQRISGWVQVAIKRDQPDVLRRFEMKLKRDADNADSLSRLQMTSGIIYARVDVDAIDSIQRKSDSDPDQPIMGSVGVTGRSVGGPVDAVLMFELTPHPDVVAAKRSLRRGHRIGRDDLELVPLARDRWADEYTPNMEDFIGLEVRGSVREGQPLSTSAVARPLMVRRGEIIRLRVSGGSIVVQTNAKALSDGHEHELIELETLDPKRKVVGRVTDIGTAEITTRAPAVRIR